MAFQSQRKTAHPLYNTWRLMVSRSTNPKHPNYRHYGARGIGLCDRWRSFNNFLEDMGERPEGMTLDRIDTTQGYSPSNCRWATRSVQSLNKIPHKNNIGGYRGVQKANKKYRARTHIHGNLYYLGVFDTPQEASRAYEDAVARAIKQELMA